METGPPPSQPLFKSAERIPTSSLSRSGSIIYTGHLGISKLRAAPGELGGISPLFAMATCAKTKRLWVCFEDIIAFVLLLGRTVNFYSVDKWWNIISLVSSAVFESCAVTPTSPASFFMGITESHGTGKRIPHPHPNITIIPIIASKNLHVLPLFSLNLPKHLLKEYPNTPLPHQEHICPPNDLFP